MTKNETHLSFCIWDFSDVDHNYLNELLGIIPSKIHVKGERVNPKLPKLAKENGWFLDSPVGIKASFEEQLNSLLDLLEPKEAALEAVCKKYYCEFSLAVYIYDREESTPSIHLSTRYHSFARKLNFEFDLDLYCLD